MTTDFPRSISDEYTEYVDDELGYQYHAWEVISASESTTHERIRLADRRELEQLLDHGDSLSDVERWAVGRRLLKMGDTDSYLEVIEPILEGRRDHPALHYPEIFVDVARRWAEKDDLDTAHDIVAKIEAHWPQLREAIPLLRAKLLLRARRFEKADTAFTEAIDLDEEVDLLFETASDFHRAGESDLARQWLDRARQAAAATDDTASMVDIELLSKKLESASESPS